MAIYVILGIVVLLMFRGGGGYQDVGMFNRSAPGNAFIPNQGPGGAAGFGAAVGPAVCQAVGSFYGGNAGQQVAGGLTPVCRAVGAEAASGAIKGVKVGATEIANVGKLSLNVLRNPTDLGAHQKALTAATVLPAKLAIKTTEVATKATLSSVKKGLSALKSLF